MGVQASGVTVTSGSATVDTRYSFGAQFLRGATIFARSAVAIEALPSGTTTEESMSEHRAFVAAAIMQAAAGLEAELAEIVMHGPGYHLGSNGVDVQARDFLIPLESAIDDQPTLERYQMVLHLLKRPQLDRGSEPFQSAALLVRLRNELIHYKSRWASEMSSSKLVAALELRRFSRPDFIPESKPFFPQRCLVADCAVWAVRATHEFLRAFYDRLGAPCSLDHFRPPLP
jgi:hypothetical protein